MSRKKNVIIGLDYFNTITKDEKFFRRTMGSLIEAGFQVHIISALKRPTDPQRKKEVLRCKVPHTSVELVYFRDYGEIAQLKLDVCKRLHVQYMIDDMESVSKLLAKNGIITFQIR